MKNLYHNQNSNAIINTFDTTGSKEIAQAIQSLRRGFMRSFDYRNPAKNKDVYGKLLPPRYNASAIVSEHLAIWSGNTDILVPAASADMAIDEMTGM